MRLHDLRHGAASLLVGAGVHTRIAQELLRHASSKTTMEIYSHGSAAQQREAVEVLQRTLAESHFESHLGPDSGGQWAKAAETGQFERGSGSGGRIRTYDQAVNSRPSEARVSCGAASLLGALARVIVPIGRGDLRVMGYEPAPPYGSFESTRGSGVWMCLAAGGLLRRVPDSQSGTARLGGFTAVLSQPAEASYGYAPTVAARGARAHRSRCTWPRTGPTRVHR
jgi:hypothetical protein